MSYFMDVYREMLFFCWFYYDNILCFVVGFFFIIFVIDEIILCLFKYDCVLFKSKVEIIKDNFNIYILIYLNL